MDPLKSLQLLKKKQEQFSNVFQPDFYRLNSEEEKQRFNELLNSPGLTINDYLEAQIGELLKFLQPQKKFSTDELILKTNEHLKGRPIHEYGVWVHYPWSNRLVHILDEEEFVTVRTSRNLYKITPEEKEILAKKKIGVIGLSVGQSVSVTLAMERICGELRLADFDILELTNLNRIRTGVHNLGLAKVYSVAREIAEIDPFIKVRCFPDGLTETNMDTFFCEGGKLDLLVEESDGFDIKILSRYKARELKIPVIMEGSDRCLVDVERFDLEPGRSILHGLVDHLDIAMLKTLKTNEQKIPYMLDILGLESCSLRLKASMLEIEQSINTWPQLASAVTMGGGITADVSRRMLLNQYTKSGRYHIDIEELIGNDAPGTPAGKQQEAHYVPVTLNSLASSINSRPDGQQVSLAEDLAREIAEAACKAPSGGNSQPWRWVYKDKILYLFNAFDGNMAILGFNNLASYVAMGAAAQNIIVAAAFHGLDVKIETFPDGPPSLVAQFRFYKQDDRKKTETSLYPALSQRLTNRMLGTRKEIEHSLLEKLQTVAEEFEGVSMKFFTDNESLDRIADLLGELEKLRIMDENGHRDFVREIRWTDEENERTRDGIDVRTLDITTSEKVGLQVARDARIVKLLNDWDAGGAFKKLTRKSVDAAGAIGFLYISKNTREDYFRGGMALEKVWLTATEQGVAFQPMAASVFLYARLLDGNGVGITPVIREKLKGLRRDYEQTFALPKGKRELFIFRLSKAADPEVMSLRKPLDELFCYL